MTIAILLGATATTTTVTANAANTVQTVKTQDQTNNGVVDKVADPQNVTVTVANNLSPQVKSAVNSSIQQWNSTKLVNLKLVSKNKGERADIMVTNSSPYDSNAWATSVDLTVKTGNPKVKRILYTKISLDQSLRVGQYDDAAVTHTIMHEMGHALGLDDNYVDPNAVMYYTSDYSSGNNPTVKLNASDYQALNLIYGN